MTKDAKSAATIRRRKKCNSFIDFERFKSSRASSPHEQIRQNPEDHESYLFDDEILGPLIVKKIMSSEKSLFFALICIRIVNSLLIQTSFVPDEYWQSIEVAHHMAYGYGYKTWEWNNGLRGYLYPSIFAIFYKILAILGMDNRVMLIKFPRIIQGVIAACGDLYLYKLSWLLSDRATAQWALFCQMTNWFMLYCSTRTLTNSTETAIVTAALYYYPWPLKVTTQQSVRRFLSLAALSILVRPTAAIIWILMCAWHLQTNTHRLPATLKHYFLVGPVTLLLSAALDRVFYGEWTCVQYNFLKFNVLGGGGSFYGTHPWHWYLTQGYPVIMGLHVLPFLLGIWRAKNKVPLLVIIWTIFIYSCLAHKEFRFLMPILPLSFHYCGLFFQNYCKKPKLKKQLIKKDVQNTLCSDKKENVLISNPTKNSTISSEEPEDNKDNTSGVNEKTLQQKDVSDMAEASRKQNAVHKAHLFRAKLLVIFLLLINIPATMYFSLIHQRGTIYVMKFLHDVSYEQHTDVLFLMPCHSTPYYSYLHRNISMRFLTCEPNLKQEDNYVDEADAFYRDPVLWLKSQYAATAAPWPSHLVYFNSLQNELSQYLLQNGYKDCASLFHTHLPEGRVGSHVIVSCR
ncbi:GPI mannosyltransferase 3-like [Dreissena polymorpha]|uniref:Mannosyltransferase n=1 Tax=Dreissena polymorpha TaxID=45954 RepID=A0A9D3YEX9_DREPO|nr:GPI mannosyltransferase 3-like [Dreissena polymorpha]KAH3697157.1 hypothetical protein DPMN_084646 [Dreissena polymorpha]